MFAGDMKGHAMSLDNGRVAAVNLARRLRELREHEWSDVTLTQADLAQALGAKSRVASATLSSWESATSPKTPTTARLNAYARFFATRRSLGGDGKPQLLDLGDLDDDERERFQQLEDELFGLHAAINGEVQPDKETPDDARCCTSTARAPSSSCAQRHPTMLGDRWRTRRT